MPLFYFKCSKCSKTLKKILSPQKAKGKLTCPKCSSILERDIQDISTICKETIDNGIMERKVEQISGIADMVKEAEKNIKKAKENKDL